MKLILVRHGETEWNVRELVQGRKDIPLNRKGMEQARKVGLRLKSERIDAIYSSDLKRASQTAQFIEKFHNTHIRYNRLLRERKFGKMEGIPASEFRKARDDSGLPKHLYRPPGGESYADLQKRVKRFLSGISKRHQTGNVLVVAHGGIIRTFIVTITKRPLSDVHDIEQHNAAVNVIELKRGQPPKVHYLNSTEHL
jgi:broad specificity phosphatase PhoE